MCAKNATEMGTEGAAGGKKGYRYLSGRDGQLRITPTVQRERERERAAFAADNTFFLSSNFTRFLSLRPQSSLQIGIVPTNRGVVQLEMDHYTTNNRAATSARTRGGHAQNSR